ncbi:MAG: hypothetical protein FWD76_06455, partial [Firmicutes bacterium]|nr:hypothetical protein [Bacillota bacterium]
KTGEETVTLFYNEDPINYSDYVIEDAPVTVIRGVPQTPESVPVFKGVYGQRLADLQDQLPAGWAFAQNTLVLDIIGQKTVAAVYNPSSANYEDNNIDVKVEVDKAVQSAPANPPSFTAMGGQRLSDKEITDQLPNANYWFSEPTTYFDTVGDFKVGVHYNTDMSLYYDFVFDADIKVSKKDYVESDLPPVQPSTAFVGQAVNSIALPSNWNYVDPNYVFQSTDVGSAGRSIAIAYNDNRDVYNDFLKTIRIRVFQDQQAEPAEKPEIIALIGQKASQITLPSGYSFVDQERIFSVIGSVSAVINYNTDPEKFSDFQYASLVVVDYRDAKQPESVPPIVVKVGTKASENALPDNFYWEDPNYLFNATGALLQKVIYNEDKTQYKDFVLDALVTVELRDGTPPSVLPSFDNRAIGSKVGDIKLLEHMVWQNPDTIFEIAGDFVQNAIYNEDSNLYKDVIVEISITVVLNDAKIPNADNVPKFGNVTVGSALRGVVLPEFYSWQSPDTILDVQGATMQTAVYNENPQVYKDAFVSVAVYVGVPIPGTDTNQIKSSEIVAVVGVVALIIFVVVIVVVVTSKKKQNKKPAHSTASIMRGGYGSSRFVGFDRQLPMQRPMQLPPPASYNQGRTMGGPAQLPPPPGYYQNNPYRTSQLPGITSDRSRMLTPGRTIETSQIDIQFLSNDGGQSGNRRRRR